ncbi:hypothetical protein [Methylomonas sp. YC3]
MRIGLDFDNTIVSYDELFHKVAREQNLVPPETPVNKLAVRDHLRAVGQEDRWTEMQGYVYGARMDEAAVYPGVIEFMRLASGAGHALAIVSHKTRHPFLGPQYDLHASARGWIERHLLADGEPLIPASQIYFELTKQEKIARIADTQCDIFVDDLPEILMAEGFPLTAERWLFDPECHHAQSSLKELKHFSSWAAIAECLVA